MPIRIRIRIRNFKTGSADPDPDLKKIGTDPQHCIIYNVTVLPGADKRVGHRLTGPPLAPQLLQGVAGPHMAPDFTCESKMYG